MQLKYLALTVEDTEQIPLDMHFHLGDSDRHILGPNIYCMNIISVGEVIKLRNLNNYNNYKTSIAPIPSKGIELSEAPSTGVSPTHNLGTMRQNLISLR